MFWYSHRGVLFQAAVTDYLRQKFISHSSGGWEVKNQGSGDLVSGENRVLVLDAVFTGYKGQERSWEALL